MCELWLNSCHKVLNMPFLRDNWYGRYSSNRMSNSDKTYKVLGWKKDDLPKHIIPGKFGPINLILQR